MAKSARRETPEEARVRGDRLRVLSGRVRSMGKLGLKGTFEAGEALEEAAVLLRGDYSSWVRTECGREPRTALGYRKTFRVLGDRRKELAKLGVTASVAIVVASAEPEARERALAAITSGRRLTVKDAERIVGLGKVKPAKARPSAIATFARLLRARSDGIVMEVERIAELAKVETPDDIQLGEMAVWARVMHPFVSALANRVGGQPPMDGDPITAAFAMFAKAENREEYEEARRTFVAALVEAEPEDTRPAPSVDVGAVAPRPVGSGNVRVSSPYSHELTALEICAGAGGAALGFAQAGFRHVALVERNPVACETLRTAFGPDHVVEADVTAYEPDGIEGLDLLSGGVPCQPYSQFGEQNGRDDDRDLFPEALRLVERLRPRAVLLENVTGLFGPKFDTYRFEIQARLRRLGYASEWRKVDASHFGVPQKRVRVILAAFRDAEAMARFRWPAAWQAHHVHTPFTVVSALMEEIESRGYRMSDKQKDRMERACNTLAGGSEKKQSADLGQQSGSKPWIEMGIVTSRFADEPPGPDHVGDIVLTRRMLAILQGFPKDWPFAGDPDPIFKQIANAFPSPVALHLGCAVATALTGEKVDPARHFVHFRRRRVRLPIDLRRPIAVTAAPAAEPEASRPRSRIPLEVLRAAATGPDEGDASVQGFQAAWFIERPSRPWASLRWTAAGVAAFGPARPSRRRHGGPRGHWSAGHGSPAETSDTIGGPPAAPR